MKKEEEEERGGVDIISIVNCQEIKRTYVQCFTLQTIGKCDRQRDCEREEKLDVPGRTLPSLPPSLSLSSPLLPPPLPPSLLPPSSLVWSSFIVLTIHLVLFKMAVECPLDTWDSAFVSVKPSCDALISSFSSLPTSSSSIFGSCWSPLSSDPHDNPWTTNWVSIIISFLFFLYFPLISLLVTLLFASQMRFFSSAIFSYFIPSHRIFFILCSSSPSFNYSTIFPIFILSFS